MNRQEARQLAETITNQELLEMFNNAKINIFNWEAVSIVNKGMTKGTAWNILAKNFDVDEHHHVLAKTNMLREFGDYLPTETDFIKKLEKKIKSEKPPVHQEPIF